MPVWTSAGCGEAWVASVPVRESMIAAEALLLAGIPSVGRSIPLVVIARQMPHKYAVQAVRSMRAILVAVPYDHSIRS